jgi:hypothetical protein
MDTLSPSGIEEFKKLREIAYRSEVNGMKGLNLSHEKAEKSSNSR